MKHRYKMILRKYRYILLMGIKNSLTYRAELMVWSIINAMPLIAMLVLWLTAFSNQESIAGYTEFTIIVYYLSGYVFSDLIGSHFEEDAIDDIRSGKLSLRFLKPLSLKRHMVANEVSWRLMTVVTSIFPALILIKIFFGDIMPKVSLTQLIYLPAILGLGFLLNSIFSLMIVAIGFVFEEAKSLVHLKWMFGWLFSGSMIPFEFMPGRLASISNFLPFKYQYYVPVQIYMGKISGMNIISNLWFELVWVMVLLVVMETLWSFCIRKFTAVGN